MAFSVAVKYMGISPIKVFPWLPLIMTPFCFGALRYWSVDHLGDMVLDSSPQWYGTTFGMLAILAAEAGLAYGINRLTERR
jgi:hypothetical protein